MKLFNSLSFTQTHLDVDVFVGRYLVFLMAYFQEVEWSTLLFFTYVGCRNLVPKFSFKYLYVAGLCTPQVNCSSLVYSELNHI